MIDLNTTNPLSFLDWKAYQQDKSSAAELSLGYNNYLIEWKEQKSTNTTNDTNYKKTIYLGFLQNINISSFPEKIQSFINEIDTDDVYELELAVHYYTAAIRQQLNNSKDVRDEIQFTKTKNNFKISKLGIEKYLHNFIINLLSNKEFISEKTDTTNVNISQISNRLKILINSLVTDNSILYKSSQPDARLVKNLKSKIKQESERVVQSISINKGGRKLKLKTNSFAKKIRNGRLSINQRFTNYNRLPERFFKNENKSLENLLYTLEKDLIEKYISNDLFLLTKKTNNYTLDNIFKSKNPTGNLFQRYGANTAQNLTNLKNRKDFPEQLSYSNTGTSLFYSSDLSFYVELSAFTNTEYVIPDPYKYQPGVEIVGNAKVGDNIVRNITIKKNVPLIYSNKNIKYKNTNTGSSVQFYNNKLLRNYGYQSQENTLDYSAVGINKKEDSINFWTGKEHNIWKNTDVYPVSNLNVYPETERLDDLIINNKTGIKLKTDLFGNEFIFLKNSYPKRLAGASYISETSTTTTDITACEVYDGLYFDSVLAAITAAELSAETDGFTGTALNNITDRVNTKYPSGSALFDTHIVSLNTDEYNSSDSFYAPLSTTACSELQDIESDSIVDCGPFVDHPCGSQHVINGHFKNTTVPYVTSVQQDLTAIHDYSTTTYEASSLNNPVTAAVHLFEQQYVSGGEIFIRNTYTQKVNPLSAEMADLFNKHSAATKTRIKTDDIRDFDIIDNTIYIQTGTETLTELYNFEDGKFKIAASSNSLIS